MQGTANSLLSRFHLYTPLPPTTTKHTHTQFSNDMRPKYKAEHPNATVTEVSAGLGELWKTLAPKEKEVCLFTLGPV